MSRLGDHPRGEGGYTLIEVIITTSLLVIVLAILAPILTGALTTFGRQSDRTGALDHAGLVLQQVEHDVLASSTLNVVAPGNDLQLIAILPAASSTVTAYCIEYKVTTPASPTPMALQRRAWKVNAGASTAVWQTLLSSLQLTGQSAGSVIPNPAGANPFTSSGSGRSVDIDLQVQNGTSPVIELKTTATGRTVTAGLSGTAAWTAQCS